jgi:hypothetical protein
MGSQAFHFFGDTIRLSLNGEVYDHKEEENLPLVSANELRHDICAMRKENEETKNETKDEHKKHKEDPKGNKDNKDVKDKERGKATKKTERRLPTKVKERNILGHKRDCDKKRKNNQDSVKNKTHKKMETATNKLGDANTLDKECIIDIQFYENTNDNERLELRELEPTNLEDILQGVQFENDDDEEMDDQQMEQLMGELVEMYIEECNKGSEKDMFASI